MTKHDYSDVYFHHIYMNFPAMRHLQMKTWCDKKDGSPATSVKLW